MNQDSFNFKPRINLKQRREDGVGYLVVKWLAGVVSALLVGGITWNFHTLIDLTAKINAVEYALKYHGLWLK